MNLIQQKQVNGLEGDLNTLSGNIVATGQVLTSFISGDSTFSGNKTFTGSGIFNTGVDIHGPLTVYNRGTFAEVGVNLPRHGSSGFLVGIPGQPNYGDATTIPRGVQVRGRNVLIASGNLHISGSASYGGKLFLSGVNGDMVQLMPHWELAGSTLDQDLYFRAGGEANGNVMIGFNKTSGHVDWFSPQKLNVSGVTQVIGDLNTSGNLKVSTDITAGEEERFKYTSSTSTLSIGSATLSSGGLTIPTGSFASGAYVANKKLYASKWALVQADYTGNSMTPNILVDTNTYTSPITITLRNPVAQTDNYEPLGVCNSYNILDVGGSAKAYPITITSAGAATINGGASLELNENSGGYNLFTNGENWFSAGYALHGGVHAQGENYQVQIRSGTQGKFAGAPGLTYNYTNSEVRGAGDSYWGGDISTNKGITASGVTITGANVPATITTPGTSGQIAVDTSYIYVCVGTNSWKRAQISGWS